MDTTVRQEQDNLICLKDNHNQPIEMFIMGNDIPFQDKLLCFRCFKTKRTISKNIIDIEQAKEMIKEKIITLDSEQQVQKKETLQNLQDFQLKTTQLQSQVLQLFNEILRIIQHWTIDIQNMGQNFDKLDLLDELKQLQNTQVITRGDDLIDKCNKSHLTKIERIFKQLLIFDDYQACYEQLNKFKIEYQKPKVTQNDSQQDKSSGKIQHELVNYVEQSEQSLAMAFNISGSIMVSGCDKDIKVWKFNEGNLVEQKRLQGHTKLVHCLVFSKKYNWFASGSYDKTIRCWKEQSTNNWVCFQPTQSHSNYVQSLILNKNEDQLLSCSYDKTIKVWKVSCLNNQLQIDYTLESKHTDYIYSMSLNETETSLVSCGEDKYIILWTKVLNSKWKYSSHVINEDFGSRICFVNDNQIAWQQSHQGFTHIYEIKNGQLLENPELKIILIQNNSDYDLFPAIYNKIRQVMILKHNSYVYILKKQNDGKFSIESKPIDCSHVQNFGTLTASGEYLVVWNDEKKIFKIYKIMYG